MSAPWGEVKLKKAPPPKPQTNIKPSEFQSKLKELNGEKPNKGKRTGGGFLGFGGGKKEKQGSKPKGSVAQSPSPVPAPAPALVLPTGETKSDNDARFFGRKVKTPSKPDKEDGGGIFGFGSKKKSVKYDDAIDLEHGVYKNRSLDNTSIDFSILADDRYEVGLDVYGLIFVSPVTSPSFLFSVIVVCVKFSLFALLILDLYIQASEENRFFKKKDSLIRATQFLLLPIAIALQEDLIYVYTRVANIKYTSDIKRQTPSATKAKFALSFVLRLIDGIASLTINFTLILTTDTVLGIFLNFAALHFLQGIDDVAFQMAHEGFLGDRMEDRCRVVQETTMARRVGDSFTNSLDSILFVTTYACMIGVWTYVFIFEEDIADEL